MNFINLNFIGWVLWRFWGFRGTSFFWCVQCHQSFGVPSIKRPRSTIERTRHNFRSPTLITLFPSIVFPLLIFIDQFLTFRLCPQNNIISLVTDLLSIQEMSKICVLFRINFFFGQNMSGNGQVQIFLYFFEVYSWFFWIFRLICMQKEWFCGGLKFIARSRTLCGGLFHWIYGWKNLGICRNLQESWI